MATKYTITLSASDWISTGGTPSKIYLSGGAFYADSNLTEQMGNLGGYGRSGYRFKGFYSGTSGGTQYANEHGSFTSAAYALTANKTWYAQGEKLSCSLVLNANNGSGGTASVYTKTGTEDGDQIFYTDANCTTPTTPTAPTRTGYVFTGFFSSTSGGTKYINADMTPTAALRSRTTDGTIYAQWQAPYKVTLTSTNWTGATAAFWYDAIGGKCYAAADMATEITTVAVPTRECYRFTGYNTASGGTGTAYIDEAGNISPDIGAYVTAAKTLYAQGAVVSYKITPAQASGTGGEGVFYAAAGETGAGRFHTDDQCTSAPKTAAAAIPTRTGYTFLGYYSAASGGTKYIEPTGEFTDAFYSATISAATTITAHWQANTYTLSFNYDGGAVSTVSKTVTYGSAVGTLPTTTKGGAGFDGWYIGDTHITSTTVWNYAADKEATAKWTRYFGTVVDFFGLASNALVPIASTTGDTRHRVTAAHGGKYESGVNQVGGIWRNPSVTYVVKANTTVSVQLGKGFAAQRSGSTMTVSGFMITTVEINTEVGKFPTVTVSAVANEGANAVNNFTENKNKFNVSVPVVARSKAQNLLGAISGGGHLQRCVLVATCDPVVCEENLMPCASDIVNGRYELAAETLAAENNAAPTMASASGSNGGFALIDDPKQTSESDFVRYTIQARREMV